MGMTYLTERTVKQPVTHRKIFNEGVLQLSKSELTFLSVSLFLCSTVHTEAGTWPIL